MNSNDRPWYNPDPQQWPCPICGAYEGDACEPLTNTGYATILRPHKERGMMPGSLTAKGYARGTRVVAGEERRVWLRPHSGRCER